MTWNVEISDEALKHLEKFEPKIQRKLIEICESFKLTPFPRNFDIKKLKGSKDIFRLRKGNARILYYVDKINNRIRVLDINVRGRIY